MKKILVNKKFSFFIMSAFLVISTQVLFSETEKPIATVLDFTVSQVSEQEAAILVDYFSGHLVASNKFRVIDRTQRQTILSELKFSYDGCTDESCQLEIGKLLAARFIFIGSLGKLGSRYILNMSLVEVETGETLKSVSDKYSSLDYLVDDTGRIISIFTEREQPAGPEPPASARETSKPEVSTAPAASTPKIIPAPKPPSINLPIFLDFGMLAGGPLEFDLIDGVCLGAYFGGLFPIIEIFYVGASLSILFSLEDFDRGTVFFGGSVCLGDPSELALGIGIEVSPAVQFTGSVILGGTITAYIGGFDIRVFYGEDFVAGPVLTIGVGGHF
ncbi:MAG: hypothetical protein JEZ04_11850 [Spirochaetales bacterium]|nr:hypothetical protein [Spirochaetales bacterium]